MTETSTEIARIDAQALAARAALRQTLSELAERAAVPARVKAKTVEVTGDVLRTVQQPRMRRRLLWLAAGVVIVAAAVVVARRNS